MKSARILPAAGVSQIDSYPLVILVRVTAVGRIVVANRFSHLFVMLARKAPFIVPEMRSTLRFPFSQSLSSYKEMRPRHWAYAAWAFFGYSTKPSQLVA
jgi:hypothetical protein